MTPNEKEKEVSDEFQLPPQVTVYSDPNSGVCESCQ